MLGFLGEERSLVFVTQYKCKPLSWRMPCDRRGFDQPHLQHSRTCSCGRIVLHVSANHHCAHSHGRAQQLLQIDPRAKDPHSPHSCLLLLWERIKNTWRARKWDLCRYLAFPSLLETLECGGAERQASPLPMSTVSLQTQLDGDKLTKTECQALATQL